MNREKSTARQAADLVDKVARLKEQESVVVEKARLRHRAKIATLVASAPEGVQVAFYALSGEREPVDAE